MQSSVSLVYLFGIVPACPAPIFRHAATVEGIQFLPCRLITEGDLSAYVSDLRMLSGEPVDQFMNDLCNVQELVLHHHRVVDGAANQTTILPLRFGSVFSNDDEVRKTLVRGMDTLRHAIDGIDGAKEWGLKIFCNHIVLKKEISSASREISGLEVEMSSASQGKVFFLERRLSRLVQDQSDQAINRALVSIKTRLEGVSRHFAMGKLQVVQVHGQESEMVFNGAFLVCKEREDEFLEAARELGEAYSTLGLELETTGPWPAYSFANCDLNGDSDAG